MFSFVGSIAGAIEGVSNVLDNVTSWLRQRERDKLVRKADDADEMEEMLERHDAARDARARAKYDKLQPNDPANRDRW